MNSLIVIALADLAMLAGSFNAYAAGGYIAFSGSVIEPTCAAQKFDDTTLLPPAAGSAPHRSTCGQTATTRGRSYSRTVVRCDTAGVSNDRLLDYFVSRDQPADVPLVVRTYE